VKITIIKKETVLIDCKKNQKKGARKLLKAVGAKETDWLESTDNDEFTLIGEIKYDANVVELSVKECKQLKA
jgi:hypothetical protein